jgi:toxin HigB-1
VGRLRIILSALDAAERADDLDIHAFRLHPLKGKLQSFWTVTVLAYWRVIFDLVDYH